MYNDVSVNENMHLATAFKILRRPGNDLWEHLSPDQFRFFRRTVIQIVLATDMAGHSELLQVNSLTFCYVLLANKFCSQFPMLQDCCQGPVIKVVASYSVALLVKLLLQCNAGWVKQSIDKSAVVPDMHL